MRITRSSSPGRISACTGQPNITFEWTTRKHTSSLCVSHSIDRLLLRPSTSPFSPQPSHTLHMDQRPMGSQVYPECEGDHFAACKAIYYSARISMTSLVQMRKYRSRMSIGVATTANVPVQPPIARAKLSSSRPTRFKIGHPALHETSPSPQESSVETEFRKYTSGEVSSEETDMLGFWEVRPFS